MNMIKLFILPGIFFFISCKNTGKRDNSTFDVNAEIKKQHRDPVTYYENYQIDSIWGKALKIDTIATMVGKSQEDIPYLILARTKPGFAEIHEQVDDVALIRSGHGTLKTGYEVTGRIITNDEEPWRTWLGEAIKGGSERKLSPGDFIIIPSMTAHQYIPDPGDTLTYWTIKIKRVKNGN